MKQETIWNRRHAWPKLTATAHRPLVYTMLVVTTVAFVLPPFNESGWWYLAIPAWLFVVLGSGYIVRTLGRDLALKILWSVLALWLVVSISWMFVDEIALGAGLIIYGLAMLRSVLKVRAGKDPVATLVPFARFVEGLYARLAGRKVATSPIDGSAY